MSRLKLALSHQIVAVLTAAGLAQLGIIGWLGYVQYENDRISDRTERAQQVSDCIGRLSEIYSAASNFDATSMLTSGSARPDFASQPSTIYEQYGLLKNLLKDKPKELAIVTDSDRAALQAMAIIQQLKDMHERGDPLNHLVAKPLLSQIHHLNRQIISPEMLELSESARLLAKQGPAKQKSLRDRNRWLLIADATLTALTFLFMALFFVRKVAYRLRRSVETTNDILNETSIFLPARKIDQTEDADEIAQLDRRFKDMAETINQIAAKQVAAVDNARDMICSLTEEGVINASNTAAGKLMGCHPSELIGKNFRSIVHRADATALSTHLQNTRSNGGQATQKTVEVRLVNRARRSVPVLWSSQWNSTDKQYFVVAHDISQLNAAHRMKQEVLAIVSNDLHGPVVNLQGFLDLLEEGSIAKVEDRGRRFIVSARRQANQMLMLINDMIDLEKAKGGLLVLQPETLNLDKVIDRAQAVIGPFAEEKGVILDCRRSGLSVNGEEDKLMRVLTNVLGYAVQSSPNDGTVLLLIKTHDSFAHVSINDKGLALSAEKVRTMFQAFAPGENMGTAGGGMEAAVQAAAAGSGSALALAMSKAFVELHGGTIAANSKPGEGTTITFTIPLVGGSGT